MAIKRYTSNDVEQGTPDLFNDGWHQILFAKTEPKATKKGQYMLTYQARALAEENNADSKKGPPVFGMVLLPAAEDDAAFEAAVGADKGLEGAALEEKLKELKRMAEDGCAAFAYAVKGYDDFPPVPRKDKESGQYLLPDGTPVATAEERSEMYDARKAAAINATIDIYEEKDDIVGYVAYALLARKTYNGKVSTEIKRLKPFLPDGESLAPIPF